MSVGTATRSLRTRVNRMGKKIIGLALCLCLILIAVANCTNPLDLLEENTAVVSEQFDILDDCDYKVCVLIPQLGLAPKYVEYLCSTQDLLLTYNYCEVTNFYVRDKESKEWVYCKPRKFIPRHIVVEIQVKDQNGIWR